MITLLVYSLKSAFVLTLLYLPYTLMLRHERFFRLNRLTLVAIMVLALVQPLWRVRMPENVSQMSRAAAVITKTQELFYQTEAVIVGADAQSAWGWQQWLALVYAAGVAVVLGLRLWQLATIHRVMRRGCLWQQREDDGTTVYCHVGNGAPFSWMHSIYISDDDYRLNGRAILLHERAHIACHHSADILLLTLTEAVQWWNPIIYMLAGSLRDVHEYEADDRVLSQGVSLADYQSLLIRKALANTSYAFANNFNRSHISKRIEMMKREQRSPWLRAKVLYVVPVLLFTLVVTAAPKVEALLILDGEEVGYDNVRELSEDDIDHVEVLRGTPATAIYGQRAKGGAVVIATKENGPEGRGTTEDSAAEPLRAVRPEIDEKPEFEGGEAALKAYISHHLLYPSEVVEHGLQGRLEVSFMVETDGTLSDVRAELSGETADEAAAVITAFGGSAAKADDERVAELMRIWKASAEKMVSEMPQWKPARKDGQPVRARVTVPLCYRLS